MICDTMSMPCSCKSKTVFYRFHTIKLSQLPNAFPAHYAPFILKKLGATWKWFLGWSKFSKACQGSKIRFIKKNPKKIASVKKYGQKTRFRPFFRISPKTKKEAILYEFWIFLVFLVLMVSTDCISKGYGPIVEKKSKLAVYRGI